MRKGQLVALLVSAFGAIFSVGTVHSAPAVIKIIMTDFTFQPARVTVRAGQTVTITLTNVSAQRKPHEFMVGRGVAKETGRPGGYDKDFFNAVAIRVSNAKGVWKSNSGEAKVTGELKPEMSGMAMGGHGGFMVELKTGGTATLTFVVPTNRVGEWEIGCFSEAGDHFTKGMKGTLVVTK